VMAAHTPPHPASRCSSLGPLQATRPPPPCVPGVRAATSSDNSGCRRPTSPTRCECGYDSEASHSWSGDKLGGAELSGLVCRGSPHWIAATHVVSCA
jgi:hypothetical protein